MTSSLTIIQITDCHLFADPYKSGYAGINPYDSLQRVLKSVSQLNPDLVIVTGDVSGDHSHISYQHFKQLWKDFGITAQLLSVAGNHDEITAWQDCFQTAHQYQQHSLLSGKWHLHLLPSDFKGAKGLLNTEAMRRFNTFVANNQQAEHIAVLHHPLTDSGVWMDKHHLLNANDFKQCLAKNRVTAVLHGHVHTDRHVMVENTPVYACPSTCWQWANTAEFGVTQQPPGFRIISLDSEGHYKTKVYYLTE